MAGVDGCWACPDCQNVNFAIRDNCNRCQAPRPWERPPPPVGRASKGGPVAGVDGNWACPACSNVNYATRDVCNRCKTPRPHDETVLKTAQYQRSEPATMMMAPASGRGRPVAGVDGNWECAMCNNINYAIRTVCNRCSTPREEKQIHSHWALPPKPPPPVGGTPIAGEQGNWVCAVCSNVNWAVRTACNRCQMPRPEELSQPRMVPRRPEAPPLALPSLTGGGGGRGPPVAGVDGNWACAACDNINFASRTACNRCGVPRPFDDEVPAEEAMDVARPSQSWFLAPDGGILDVGIVEAQQHEQALPTASPSIAMLALGGGGSGCGKGGRPVAGVDGNWGCPYCNNVNYASREACNRCQAPRPAVEEDVNWQQMQVAVVAQQPPSRMSSGGRGGPPVAGVDGNWVCSMCDNVNYAMREACNRCRTPKEDACQQLPPPPPSTLNKVGGFSRNGPPVAGLDGAWACPYCENVNFATRTACNRCHAPRPEAQPGEEAHPLLPVPSQQLPRGLPVAGVDGNWACPSCHNVNYASRQACNRCQLPRPAEVGQEELAAMAHSFSATSPRGGPPVAGIDGNWACSLCHNVNYAVRENCNRCQAPRSEAAADPPPQVGKVSAARGRPPVVGENGNWACPLCQNVNFGMRDICNRCQFPRPTDELVAGGVLGVFGVAEDLTAEDDADGLPPSKRLRSDFDEL